MDQRIKELWVAALESGEFVQTKCMLRNSEGWCCLGVLSELHRRENQGADWVSPEDDDEAEKQGKRMYLGATAALPEEVQIWAGLGESMGAKVRIDGQLKTLDTHNDSGVTFAQIAKAIREQL